MAHPASVATPETDWRIGTLFAGFVIDQVLARSPITTTYRGHDAAAMVAIKITHAVWAQRPAREPPSQFDIEHPSIARLVTAGRLPCGSRYLVSEWIAGETLEERLERGIEWRELIPILSAIAAGLTAIRDNQLVHRDLKPTNIALPEGGRPGAVILDVGHRTLLGAERLTDRRHVLGSAAYMSPEQAAGATVDHRTDLYALGVILYRALTGVLPFERTSAAALLRCHQEERVVMPRRRTLSQIPIEAEQLCMWLLAKRPEARVPSAQVLRSTLHAFELRQSAPAMHDRGS